MNVNDSMDVIMNLLEGMPNYFVKNTSAESIFQQAITSAKDLLKNIGGKILVFQYSAQVIKNPLLNPKQVPNNQERTDLVNATSGTFHTMASELAHQQISLDMFVFVQPGQQIYKNLSTMGDFPKFASGNLYYYPGFNARTHGMKFSNELYDNLTRKIAWEAVFRIRLSEGFKQIGSYGNILIK